MSWYELVNSRDGSVREYDTEDDALSDVLAMLTKDGVKAIDDWELERARGTQDVTSLARGATLAQRAKGRFADQRRSA